MIRVDRQEEGETRGEKVAHPAHRSGRLRKEINRLKAMDMAMAYAPNFQISLNDSEVRDMSTRARNGGMDGKDGQTSVDAKTYLINLHDRDQLSQMAMAAKGALGSGLIDYIQKMTIAAMAMADMKVWAQRS